MKAKSSAMMVNSKWFLKNTGKSSQTYGRVKVEAKSIPATNLFNGIALNLRSTFLMIKPTASSMAKVRSKALRKFSS